MAVRLTIWIEETNLAEDDQYADLNAVGARIVETLRPTNYDGQYAFSLDEDPDENTEGDTVQVWIMEHGDPALAYVVNTREDMEGNFRDLENENVASFPITFESYLQSWTSVLMPKHILDGDEEARAEWLDENLPTDW